MANNILITSLKNVTSNTGSPVKEELLNELIDNWNEAKRQYYLGNRDQCITEAGKFSENWVRLLYFIDNDNYPPENMKFDKYKNKLKNESNLPKEIRLTFLLLVEVIYRMRNSRHAAHTGHVEYNPGDDIITLETMSWTILEMISNFTNVSDAELKQIRELILIPKIPKIDVIAGKAVILDRNLSCPDSILVLLTHYYPSPISIEQIDDELKHHKRTTIQTNIGRLLERRHIAGSHIDKEYELTSLGLSKAINILED